jgi:hypothetical protein
VSAAKADEFDVLALTAADVDVGFVVELELEPLAPEEEALAFEPEVAPTRESKSCRI